MMSYQVLKQSARLVADACVEETSGRTVTRGRNDSYDLIMSDKDDVRQSLFLLKITNIFTVDERKVLLNGLAQEYSAAEDWLDYCSVKKSRRHEERREAGRAGEQQD